MPSYVAELKTELAKTGPTRFVEKNPHPVLVVLGLTGTLQGAAQTGTVVAQSSDTLLLSAIVGRVFPVLKGRDTPRGPVLVGRTSDNDICVPEYSISKHHCSIAIVGREIRITDSGSTNGTSINGHPIAAKQGYLLDGGETLSLGRFAFRFFRAQGFVEYLRAS